MLKFTRLTVLALVVACAQAGWVRAAELLISGAGTWRYWKGTGEASDPLSAWRTLDFVDTAWALGQAPFGYGSGAHEAAACNTVFSDMATGAYTTLFLRRTFTVADPAEITGLKLGVEYDDGFIVWLNGERVAADNGPDNPTYDSIATGTHEADVGYVAFELADPAGVLVAGENILAVQAFNLSPSSDFKIDVELSSFRRVADTKFSHDRGFYDAPFTCTVTTATPGATLAYTLNGSDPRDPEAAHVVFGTSPLAVLIDPASTANRLINGATAPCVVLRAYAFHADSGYTPTDVDTHTYLFLAQVPYQPDTMSGEDWIPGSVNPAYSHKYTWPQLDDRPVASRLNAAMDPALAGDATYRNQVLAGLRALPAISIVTDYGHVFGNSHGIMHNSLNYGVDWERPGSVEMILTNGETAFQVDCGLRVSGAGSRDPRMKDKLSVSLRFKSQYGASKLNYALFPDTFVDSFDKIRLRAGGNARFDKYGYEAVQQIRDSFGRSTQKAMSGIGAHETWAHLYINGMYWGLYNPCEVPGDAMMASYFGGEKEDYDGVANKRWYTVMPTPPDINGMYRVIDGDHLAWETLTALTNTDLSVSANYSQIKNYLDVDRWIDYHIAQCWGMNIDWAPPTRKYIANCRTLRKTRNRLPGDPQFTFFVWDYEVSMDRVPASGVASNLQSEGIAHLHRWLKDNRDYRVAFSDRIYKHMLRADGALAPTVAANRYAGLANTVELPMVCEVARWGDASQTAMDGPALYNNWKSERDGLLANWIPQRTAYAFDDFKAEGLYPLIDPPEFHQEGAAISAGFKLTITNPNGSTGTLKYKTDGGDPRASGGGNASGSATYSGAIALARTTQVKARVRKSSTTWSALQEAVFNYTAHYPLIRLTEIHYNPLGGGEFEFLELKNISGSTTVGLSGMSFDKGLRYTFAPGAELGPGKFAVLVRNLAAFTNRYRSVAGSSDVDVFAAYRGKLDNGGERVRLVDTDGTVVTSVRYNDKAPWPEQADGDGFSLVFDGTGDQDEPAKWRASNLIGGSPGYDDGAPYRVLVNEALTHTDPPLRDAIELYNAGATSVNIGGWYLSDSDNNYRKFLIPSCSLPAGGYVVFDETDFNTDTNDPACFALDSAHGDEVYLTRWDAHSNLLYLAAEDFGAAANGVAFGRHTTSDGDVDFVAQSVSNTLGAANAYPRVGPVVINELMDHPVDGDDEFIELHNMSAGPVALYAGTNTWKLTDAVSYTFPQAITLTAGEYILVVPTNAAAFRARYGIPAAVRIFGPYEKSLDNSPQNGNERVELKRPDTPEPDGFVPYILVERIKYNDDSPWPESADGGGPSLERIAPSRYGNEPANWSASLTAGGTPGSANSGVLVSKTAGWKYHDRGTDLGTTWRAAVYDDSGWEHGNAPLGYPDTDFEIDTEIDFGADPGNKHITTYFRKAFSLEDPADVDTLTLRIRYDDGYVVYLNGQEVVRGTMDYGTVSYGTLANAANGSEGAYDEENLNAEIGKLVAGVNVLAVEVHQASASSSDLFLDLELVHTVTQSASVAAPTVRFPSSSSAGSESQTSPSITVELSTTSTQTVRVDYQTTGGGTASAGQDFTATSGTFTFSPGQTQKSIALTVTDDGDEEDDETVVLQLSNPQNATLGTGTHTYTITDNDALFTAYNDLSWGTGQLLENITRYTTDNGEGTPPDGASGFLLDFDTGETSPVTLAVAGGNWNGAAHTSLPGNPDAGTDASQVFSNKVDCTGHISYNAANLTLTFSGLDSGQRYELVVFGNRDNLGYTGRTSRLVLTGVASNFVNQSTTGAAVSTTTLPDDTTTIANGYNTSNGLVARWTNIDPGGDGAMLVTVYDDTTLFYVNALMLRACSAAAPASIVRVAKGADWKYRRGSEEASDPADVWRSPSFDDSGWTNGPAPFGYGDGPYGTDLTGMQGDHTSVFLRREFTVEHPARVDTIALWALYDDGFILWINGAEVARHAMAGVPGSFVAYHATATNAVGDGTAWTKTLTGSALPVLDGTNTLAIQVFNASVGSSDLTMDVELAVTWSAAPGADADGDGLPDDYENAWLSGTGQDATGDKDGDGVDNLSEWVLGTDPDDDGTDTLELATGIAAGSLVVSFPTLAAGGTGYVGLTRHYGLQQRTEAAGPWTDVPGYADLVGTNQTVSYTNPAPSAATQYRARVWLE